MQLTCDICGRVIEGEPVVVEVDGAVLNLCQRCASKYINVKGVKILSGNIQPQAAQPRTPLPARRLQPQPRPQQRRAGDVSIRQAERLEIIENFGEVIKDARTRMGMSRDVLAGMLGIKESTLRNIEEGKLIPDINLARKIEKVLRVKLLVEGEEYSESGTGGAGIGEVTLGDIVEIRKRDSGK